MCYVRAMRACLVRVVYVYIVRLPGDSSGSLIRLVFVPVLIFDKNGGISAAHNLFTEGRATNRQRIFVFFFLYLLHSFYVACCPSFHRSASCGVLQPVSCVLARSKPTVPL